MKSHAADFMVSGESNLTQSEPYLLVVNHFNHPGFSALWIAVAIESVVPHEMRWFITDAWTFPGRKARNILQKLSHIVLMNIASVYHFFPLPPNPPELDQSTDAALTIRKILHAARANPKPTLAMAPEGRDFTGGVLGMPAKGTGTIVAELCRLGYSILPVGFYEKDSLFHIEFGKAYRLNISPSFNRKKDDPYVSSTVMQSIARLLPLELQGIFSTTKE
jgi:1-acyl-sn-glycerol-3-phosphate acyltransferase